MSKQNSWLNKPPEPSSCSSCDSDSLTSSSSSSSAPSPTAQAPEKSKEDRLSAPRPSMEQPTSSTGGKTYRNSPFGLTNHFIGMPDTPDADMRVPQIESSSAASSVNLDGHWQTNIVTKQPSADDQYLTDADAGIDAPKCNAKDKAEQVGQPDHDEGDPEMGGETSSLQQPSPDQSSGLLVLFSSIMYATFLVILGCIFHISQLRQKSKNSSDHIYTIVVALLGMGWLMFLQLDLQRYKRYASKYILIESIFSDHKRQQQRRQQHRARLLSSNKSMSSSSAASSSPSQVSSTGSLVAGSQIDRLSMNTEVVFKQTAYRIYQQRAAMAAGNRLARPLDQARREPPLETRKEQPVALEEPAYKFLHGKMGANFYLKCGMAAFCFGHVIHEGLRFGQQLYFFGTGNAHCRDSAAIVAHLVTPLYSFYQLFMMFKYSNLVINRHKILAKFGLMHIIGTSVSFWFRTILEEAFEDFVHKMDYFKAQRSPPSAKQANDSLAATLLSMLPSASAGVHQPDDPIPLLSLMSSPMSASISPQIARQLPDSYACAQNTLLTTKSMNALPYLYPFTIEYNLLLAATFLSLYFNIGRVGARGQGHPSCRQMPERCVAPRKASSPHMSSSRPASLASFGASSSHSHPTTTSSHDNKSLGEYKSNFVVNADCHSANKGLFCGFFVLLVTLVTIVIFFVTINKPHHVHLGIKINLIQEATLTALILVVTLAAIRQLAKLNRNTLMRDKVTTDDVLMLIPLPFFFIHSLLSFRAESASVLSSLNSSSSRQLVAANSTSGGRGNRARSLASSSNSSVAGASARQAVALQQLLASTTSQPDTSQLLAGVDRFKLLAIALNVVVMIEVLVQTNFIIDGMRRCSESRYLRFKKPGRELITFAILLNITYWIVATFETKSVEQYKSAIEYYGPLPYMFISHTTLPVMLFYRYHSSVCLTEIWNRAYKPPKAKT